MKRMYLFELLRKESAGSRLDIFLAVFISGAANAGILAIINTAAQTVSSGQINLRLLILFITTIVVYIVALRYTFKRSTRIFEGIVNKSRIRIAEKIFRTE